MNLQASKNTYLIKHKAAQLGFQYCGLAKADFLASEAPALENWLKEGKHGTMGYMENYFDKRLDPRKLVDGAKSVVSLLYNYFPPSTDTRQNLKISKYAYGKDYHIVIKEKLNQLLELLREEIGDINGRAFVDSAPVMEKAWATKAGNGWTGKNGNLINKSSGSFFFLAELVVDIEFEYDGPIKDYCGTCTRCMDACPTGAIAAPYVVDGSKCISYLTIELKESIPQEFAGKMDGWVFGCDVCQDVCPWNKFAKPHHDKALLMSDALQKVSEAELEEISLPVFQQLFKDSAVKRAKWQGLKRNIEFVKRALG